MAPQDDVGSVPGYLLAAEVLRVVAPDELEDLPSVWEDYLRDPIEFGDLGNDDRLLGAGMATESSPTATQTSEKGARSSATRN
ncbi:MAG TPA: hypothetical protein VFO16_24655 [Pseudonocardiaceae bacterium]|nr:hypothetical protein [Pseudonocardiaceae bacterium]